jgi:hypothetical protein
MGSFEIDLSGLKVRERLSRRSRENRSAGKENRAEESLNGNHGEFLKMIEGV